MEIIVGKKSGFCSGVKYAVDKTQSLCEEFGGHNITTLGYLIHNNNVIRKLEKQGVRVIDDIDKLQTPILVIRSHGESKEIFETLSKKSDVTVVDCTCSFVRKVHELVEKHYNMGYQIVIVGNKNHPEIIGTNGWCENNAIIIDDENFKLNLSKYEKVCVVSQTTFDNEKFDKIVKNFSTDGCKTVEVFNTICYTTKERQKETYSLSKQCEAMIVVGGKNSSNTTELFKICENNCKNVFFIESIEEVEFKALKKYNKIGLVAGASTPRELIKEVFLNMADSIKETKELNEGQITMQQVVEQMEEKKNFRIGQILKATISQVSDDGISVLLPGQKAEILIAKDEVSSVSYESDATEMFGTSIDVMVIEKSPLKLSIKALEQMKVEESEIDKIADGAEFTMTFSQSNKGGLTGNFGSYRVFVPASEIRIGFVSDIASYVGKQLKLKIKEIDRKGKKIVASQKDVLLLEKEAKNAIRAKKEQEFLESLEVGQIVNGKVVRASNFGIFVSVKGFDCLAHKTDLSWNHVEDCTEVVEIGQSYDFKVLKVDVDKKRVSLGLKQLQAHPWETVAERYSVDDVVKGKVVKFASFGAFVEIEKGIEGLIHVSQIAYDWIEKIESALTIGQEVEVKIIELDPKAKKMTLSMKALLPEQERSVSEEGDTAARRPKNMDRFKRNSNASTPASSERRERAPRRERVVERREPSINEWISEGSGASIGELLQGFSFDSENED